MLYLPLQMQLTAEQWQTQRWEREVEQRNRPLSDEELDSMMPVDGYKVLEAPPGYAPIRTPARKLMATPTPIGGTPMYQIPEEDRQQAFDVPIEIEGLPEMKPEDQQYFGKLLKVCSNGCVCASRSLLLLLTSHPTAPSSLMSFMAVYPGLGCVCMLQVHCLSLSCCVQVKLPSMTGEFHVALERTIHPEVCIM